VTLADVTIADLLLVGTDRTADVAAALTAADLVQSMEQAPTLTLNLVDVDRVLLSSGLFSSRLTVTLDGVIFELVRIAKSGPAGLTLTLEDAAVADLRKRMAHRKVAANTTTRSSFARQLVAEVPWIRFEGPANADVAKVELARGKPDLGSDEKPQDTWAALDDIASAIGWRRFARANTVVFTSDAALLAAGSVATLAEFQGGVDAIDYEYDAGLAVATATVSARAGRWSLAPGACVEVTGQGPADGRWLVSEVRRSLYAVATTVTLIQPQPTLPEPVPTAEPEVPPGSPSDYVEQGPVAPVGAVSSAGLSWPTAGRLSSGFGAARPGGRRHAGIDLAAATGTAVVAAAAGTVSTAGNVGGYGIVAYVDHADGVQTRYAHLSRVTVRAGQKVAAGARLGDVGSTGNSSGPHLHFEVRRNGSPVDPLTVLPKR
jgi:murein DD-endopeptidase MepM/ murein hydrolase activator NlpD